MQAMNFRLESAAPIGSENQTGIANGNIITADGDRKQTWIAVGDNGHIIQMRNPINEFIDRGIGGINDFTNIAGMSVAAASTENQFVGVMAQGQIYADSNGDSFTLQHTAAAGLFGIAHNNDSGSKLWVACGANGTSGILTSADGITWTVRTSTTTQQKNGVAYDEKHALWIVVAGAGDVETSPDGITWTSRTSGVANALRAIDVAAHGVAMAVGDNGDIIRSTDGGVTWKIITEPHTSSNMKSIATNDKGVWILHDSFAADYLIVSFDDGLTFEFIGLGGNSNINGFWAFTDHVNTVDGKLFMGTNANEIIQGLKL